MEEIKKHFKKWEEGSLKNILNRFPERKPEFKTRSGIQIDRLSLPTPEFDYSQKLGFPGEYPFTRGIQPTMYRGRYWTMRQYAGFATAEESNQRYRYLLKNGSTGLSVAFDLPTQIGYDSDHPLAEGEVGRVGVAIDSLQDLEVLFNQIPLEKVSTSMTINSTAAILLAMYIALARKQGAEVKKLRGTIQNDILKEYIARGTYIFPPDPSMRIITDIFEYCNQNLPRWNTISISGYHIREAGATAVQELAFTFANAIAYVQAAIDAGLEVDDFAGRVSFFFNAHNSLFEEVAKFRAARRLWAKIMKDRFGAKKPGSMKLRFHTQTAGSSLTAQQPENNVVRTTIQALAAVLGGTQSLHTNSPDEALGLPTEESARIAIRTQQIIASESGVPETVDPLGGSYFVEYLTDEIEKKATEYIEKIDEMGGAVEAVKNSYFQNEIARSAYQYQKDVEQKKEIIVGVNEFVSDESQPETLLKIDPAIAVKQTKNLKRLRRQRDGGRVRQSLAGLKEIAENGGNLMPGIIRSVELYATVGEICGTLREVFGEYQQV